MLNTPTGENVNTGTWNAGQTITRTFTTTLNTAWAAGHCQLNFFVYKFNSPLGVAEVQNAIKTPVIPTGTTRTYTFSSGWHLVSVPLAMADYRTTVLFPGASSPAYTYQGGYETRDSLDVGSGYWIKFPSPQVVSLLGDPVAVETVDVAAGWNLVGSLTDSVAVASVVSIPTGIIASGFFEYGPSGYTTAQYLVPSRGYWLKANQAGQIILRSQP